MKVYNIKELSNVYFDRECDTCGNDIKLNDLMYKVYTDNKKPILFVCKNCETCLRKYKTA